MRHHPERFTVRFDEGVFTTLHPLPIERAERIAVRGTGEHGKFHVAEILDAAGEVFVTVATLPISIY